jgi:hypothetical protein
MMSVTVISWWYFLCGMGAINIVAWTFAARAYFRRQPARSGDADVARRLQLLLSALYVFGCAYRSVFLVYDVPRICLWNTWLSSVAVGRSVATVAELCFVAQWALLLRETALATGSRTAYRVSLLLVPLIAIAETCSWYSVLTTSNLGHVAEESLWGLSVALLVVSVLAIMPRGAPARRPVLLALCVAGLAYVAFMFVVDVPMYWSRWIADEASGRQYLTLAQGIVDVAQHRVVSYRWENWKHEVAWMSLYFSVAVWISISLTALRTSSRWSAQCRRPTSEKPTLGSQILATSTSLSRN